MITINNNVTVAYLVRVRNECVTSIIVAENEGCNDNVTWYYKQVGIIINIIIILIRLQRLAHYCTRTPYYGVITLMATNELSF